MTKYTNSPLVSYTKLSPNHSGERTHSIDTITVHAVCGQVTVETLGDIFAPTERGASSNYGIGLDGRIGMYVEEKNRSWCSGSRSNDHRAITIETSCDTTHPYNVRDVVYSALIDLCTDICKRNGKDTLIWIPNKDEALAYERKENEMLITVHMWFQDTDCPGEWILSHLSDVARQVTKRFHKDEEVFEDIKLYKVQTGAFSIEQNAKNLSVKLKADGFDTYIIKEDNWWKVQTGAYEEYDNAEAELAKLKAKGYEAFIKTVITKAPVTSATKPETPTKVESNSTQPEQAQPTPSPAPSTPAPSTPAPAEPKKEVKLGKGDTIKINAGARSYNGVKLASFVYETTYTVLKEPEGDRVVVGYGNTVITDIHAADLTLIKKANIPVKIAFNKGDRVKVNAGAKSYEGVKLASFVYKTVYTVLQEPKGDRVVIGDSTCTIAAVHAKDLKHV